MIEKTLNIALYLNLSTIWHSYAMSANIEIRMDVINYS